jgi:hypothetical protein
LDKPESKKKLNELSIIKKRRKRRGTNQNSKRQGGCLQIQWHVIFKTSIKKNSVQDNERKRKTMSKKNLSRSRAWVLSEGQPVKPKEWFLVPLQVIDEAVKRIRDGSITDVVYDPKTLTFVSSEKK